MQISELFVLVVEPSAVQRRIIKDSLAKAGVSTIREAGTAAEALASMLQDPPDLLISSMYLEDMSGADLLAAVRADEFIRDTAFILISTETRFQRLDPVKQGGATAILPKPYTDAQMMTALRTSLLSIDTSQDAAITEIDMELLNVLLVDDSATSRKFIRNVLTNLGLQNFTEAEDGQDAINKLSEDFFDLVVTDYNMPHINGQELTEYIRTQSGQSSVPVLMVTSEANEGRLSGIQQSGVSALCDKPFSVDQIKQLLLNLLSEG